MRALSLLAQMQRRTCYQGGLSDKDRIFTNLYNDTSPYLEGARKRVSPIAHATAPTSLLARAPPRAHLHLAR